MQFAIPNICPDKLFSKVKAYLSNFELDDRAIEPQQFMVLSKNEQLLAFGRVRHHEHCDELCSVGVIEEARHLGLGKKLVQALITSTQNPLYLVSVIPAFFESLGFEVCTDYPPEMDEKLQYCKTALTMPEAYVVMRLKA